MGYVVVQKSLYFSFHKSRLGRDKIFQEKETLNNGASDNLVLYIRVQKGYAISITYKFYQGEIIFRFVTYHAQLNGSEIIVCK